MVYRLLQRPPQARGRRGGARDSPIILQSRFLRGVFMVHGQRREFRRENFRCSRDWVHFCAEFELKICHGCRRRSRVGIGISGEWRCTSCMGHGRRNPLPLHPDLWQALNLCQETKFSCPICQQMRSLSRAWISEDARRLYCRSHLKPIRTADRIQSVERQLRKLKVVDRPIGAQNTRRLQRLTEHLAIDRCRSCRFNGSAVYRGNQLLEIDSDRRRCISPPDALNCAGIDH